MPRGNLFWAPRAIHKAKTPVFPAIAEIIVGLMLPFAPKAKTVSRAVRHQPLTSRLGCGGSRVAWDAGTRDGVIESNRVSPGSADPPRQ
ncbi:hypothetical protein [Glutamicibacter sp. TV12E]|uniref:hypothetical protein n=1 Tax=Glutamicibacter sp. TV12E TaxID=3446362 RepID=UPI0040343116